MPKNVVAWNLLHNAVDIINTSIKSTLWGVNRILACLAGIMAECVHLCRVAGNTV